MTTTINNKHKKLNFSSEREQSQACLNSAEHEKNQGRKVLNVPNLRFPEFQGEWEKKRLEECVEFLDGLRKPIKSEDRKSEQGLYPYYGASGIIDYIDGYLFDGEYILLSEDGANIIDRNYRVAFIAKGKIWVNNHAHVLQPYDGFDINFLSETLERLNYAVYNTGTTMPKLNQEVCRNINLKIPTTKEQNKIGNLLSLLNERIATQNKIIEDLKKLKSAIIDYAINSLDSGFVKFGSLYEMAGEGGTPTTSNASFYDNGKIPFIKIDDLKKKYLTENKDFITELGLQKSSAWLVPSRSILFSNGATIGEITITTYPVCTKQGILGIVPKQNIDVEFLYYFMSSSYFKKAVSRIVTEGTMKTAYLKDINNILCPIPTKEKQQEIAKMPSALNSKIDFEQSILKLFCSQKQYLLRQMFI